MKIPRDRYLKPLVASRGNGQVKVITGIRRCGKSYLLKQLFRDYLLADGVDEKDILILEQGNCILILFP